ncbi:MAG: hypothetical protein ACKVX7_01985 [Planctomycetota bacterium]
MIVVGIGGSAGLFLQAWQIFAAQSAEDIHLGAALINTWVCGSWLSYGFWVRSKVLVCANVPAVVAAAAILVGKLYFAS